jgi:hypothetical protein
MDNRCKPNEREERKGCGRTLCQWDASNIDFGVLSLEERFDERIQ